MNTQTNRDLILLKREEFLKENPDAFKGNTKARKDYLDYLNSLGWCLTDYQFDVCIGLVLSDASLQKQATGTRLKIQQSVEHQAWLEHIKDCLLEYSGSNAPFNPSGRDMLEYQTLTCKQIDPLLDYFYPKLASNITTTNTKNIKEVLQTITPFITPVSVAYWFQGDGDKAGRTIEFNTQGFTKDECDILADALRNNLKLDAKVNFDSVDSKGIDRYTVDLGGPCYDSFVEQVGPYVHECMQYKFPAPRQPNSRFGYMKKDLFDSLVGSELKKSDLITSYTRPTFENK